MTKQYGNNHNSNTPRPGQHDRGRDQQSATLTTPAPGQQPGHPDADDKYLPTPPRK